MDNICSANHLSIYVGSFSATTTCWCYKWNLLHCWMHSTVGCQQVPKPLKRDNSLSIRKTYSMIQSWKLQVKAATYLDTEEKKQKCQVCNNYWLIDSALYGKQVFYKFLQTLWKVVILLHVNGIIFSFFSQALFNKIFWILDKILSSRKIFMKK